MSDEIDITEYEDVAHIVIKINNTGDIRVQTLFNGDFRDYLRRNDNDRKDFMIEFLKAINKSVDEEGQEV